MLVYKSEHRHAIHNYTARADLPTCNLLRYIALHTIAPVCMLIMNMDMLLVSFENCLVLRLAILVAILVHVLDTNLLNSLNLVCA